MNTVVTDRIYLADPHPFFRKGVRQFLENNFPSSLNLIHETHSGKELVKSVRPQEQCLIIMDLNLSELDGFEVLKKFEKADYAAKCLILSAYSDPKIIKNALQAGALGFLLKRSSEEELLQAMSSVSNGETYFGSGVQLHQSKRGKMQSTGLQDRFARKYLLTRREVEVLKLISDALSNKEIARRLYISDQTVGVHRKNIMRKLGVNSVAELMRTAYDHSLI